MISAKWKSGLPVPGQDRESDIVGHRGLRRLQRWRVQWGVRRHLTADTVQWLRTTFSDDARDSRHVDDVHLVRQQTANDAALL